MRRVRVGFGRARVPHQEKSEVSTPSLKTEEVKARDRPKYELPPIEAWVIRGGLHA